MKTNFAEEFEQKYVGKYLKYFVPNDVDIEIQVNEEYCGNVIKNFETKFGKIESMGLSDYLIRIFVENCDNWIYVSFNEDFEIFDTNPNELLNK